MKSQFIHQSQFINNSLVHSLSMGSVLALFLSVLGTVHFRQDEIDSAQRIRDIEVQCTKLQNHEAEIVAYISQLESPYLSRNEKFVSENISERVMKVRDWKNHRESFVTRNTLAMSRRQREFQF